MTEDRPLSPGTGAAGTLRDHQYRLLVEAVTDYAIYMLDPTGHVATWNTGAERIKGYAPDEIIGRHFSVFFTPEDIASGKPLRALEQARTKGRFEDEAWRCRKDGSRFWAFAVLDAIRDKDGTLIGFAKVTRDMTERREAQLNLEKAREQLFQSQKLESLGQIAGGVAHDFNNLLAAVLSGLSLIERRVGADKEIDHILGIIRLSVEHGQSLIRHLLSFSRHEQLAPQKIFIQDRLAGMLNLAERMLGNNIQVKIDLPEVLPALMADPNQLELAILNVCLNARDAMPNGGTLTISADCDVGTEGPQIALRITDTGTGIPPDLLPQIFEPFFTTKEVGKGSGLGLSQVYGFVKETGGSVDIESTVGSGTTVSIRLPVAGDDSEASEAHSSAPSRDLPENRARRGTILMVEDDLRVGELTKMLFEDNDYTVKLVHSAADALDMLRNHGPVDVVLTDIIMPGGINGRELARIIRAEFPQLPIVMTTGHSGRNVDETHIDGIPVLRKPCSAAQLFAAIDEAMARRGVPAAGSLTSP